MENKPWVKRIEQGIHNRLGIYEVHKELALILPIIQRESKSLS